MSPIRPTSPNPLVEVLTGLKRATGRKGAAAPEPLVSTPSAGLRERLTAIVADTPEADADALRMRIVRCILAQHWGEDSEDDPLFLEAVAAVEYDLKVRPDLARLFRRAVVALASAR